MELKLVSHKLAEMLKEKGYDSYISNYYYKENGKYKSCIRGSYAHTRNECIPAPGLELAKMWFREKHKIHIVILPTIEGYFCFKIIDIQLDPNNKIDRPPYKEVDNVDYNIYEEALEAGLIETCKIIKK